MRTKHRHSLSAHTFLAALGAALPLGAQTDAVQVPAMIRYVKAPEPVLAGERLDVPAPPRAILTEPAPHGRRVVPVGPASNRPQPDTAPALAEDPDRQLVATGTGAFTFFRNQVVRPSGSPTYSPGAHEPSAVIVRDTALQTGNKYAALSKDSGMTWTDLNPFTFFPATDGGFASDQRVEYVKSHDLTVWQLQYFYSASTQKGSYRIAVAQGRDRLRSGVLSDWTRYLFDPRDFGFGAGNWLDFPDVCANDDWFYVSANVFDGGTGNNIGSVVWRMSLADMAAGGLVTVEYQTDAALGGGGSYRFANGGLTSRMYWADTIDTTTIRIWMQETFGLTTYVDRTTASWNSAVATCTGPDLLDWISNAVGRIRGACGSSTELVFFWTSAAQLISPRPLPYTRIARFRAVDRTLIAEHDLWSTSLCWAFAAAESSSLGDIGVVIAVGGPSRIVHSAAFLIDQYQAWSGINATNMALGTSGPSLNRWGDYYDVQRSWHDDRTFIGTGFEWNGGNASANAQPRFAWFGRNDYQPNWVTLSAWSTPVTGVALTMDVTDRNGFKDGTTNFTRSFTEHQGYELTAPATHTAGASVYLFDRWVLNGLPQAIDQRVLVVSDCGVVDDTAVAEYLAQRALAIASEHPSAGVAITVSPNGVNGAGNGTTPFNRNYKDGTQVTLTAPASQGGVPFKRWQVGNALHALGQTTITITVSSDRTATARYYEHVAGSFTAFGAGCAGSNGVDTQSAIGTPEIGQQVTYRLANGRTQSAAILLLGFDNQSWLGVPLPLALPNAPGCTLLTAIESTFVTATDNLGRATWTIGIPNDVSAVETHAYTQWACFDPGANDLNLTFSNGIDTLVGGNR